MNYTVTFTNGISRTYFATSYDALYIAARAFAVANETAIYKVTK